MKKFIFEAGITGTCCVEIEAKTKEEALEMYAGGICHDYVRGSEEWEYHTFDGIANSYFCEEVKDETD